MSGTFTKLTSLKELTTSKLMHTQQNGHDLCLAYVDGEVYAVDDMCAHEDASLAKGSLHGDCVNAHCTAVALTLKRARLWMSMLKNL